MYMLSITSKLGAGAERLHVGDNRRRCRRANVLSEAPGRSLIYA